MNPTVPLSISPLPLIGRTTPDDNFTVWCAINLGVPTHSRDQRYMTDPGGSQQPSMSLIRSSYRPRASCEAVPTSPANGSTRYSKTESRKEDSSAVSSSPKSSACTLLVASHLHWHMTAFSKALMTVSNAVFVRSIIGFGGRTRRMRSVICENFISDWRTGAITGTSYTSWWYSFRRFLIRSCLSYSYKRIYSTGEMKSHRCVSLQGPPALTATVKPKDNANGPVDDTLKSERTTRPKDVLFESWPTSLTVISSPSN